MQPSAPSSVKERYANNRMYDELLPGRQVTTALKPDQQSRWYVVDFRWTGTVAVGRLHHLDEPWREKHVLVRTPRLSADPPEMTP